MVFPAAVTPFLADGKVDHVSVLRLMAWFRSLGCDGVLLAGTNGEGPSLSAFEKRDLMRHACDCAGGLEIILGVMTNSLEEALWLTRQAKECGAAAVLVLPPTYYRDFGQEGLLDWFTRLLSATEFPTFLYNIPQRAGIAIEVDTFRQLLHFPHLAGLKDSSGKIENLESFAAVGDGRRMFVGDERLLLPARQAGWTGTISGSANLLGGWLSAIDRDHTEGSAKTRMELILPHLSKLRSSPVPQTFKHCLVKLGVLDRPEVRSPLMPVASDTMDEVWEGLKSLLVPEGPADRVRP